MTEDERNEEVYGGVRERVEWAFALQRERADETPGHLAYTAEWTARYPELARVVDALLAGGDIERDDLRAVMRSREGFDVVAFARRAIAGERDGMEWYAPVTNLHKAVALMGEGDGGHEFGVVDRMSTDRLLLIAGLLHDVMETLGLRLDERIDPLNRP